MSPSFPFPPYPRALPCPATDLAHNQLVHRQVQVGGVLDDQVVLATHSHEGLRGQLTLIILNDKGEAAGQKGREREKQMRFSNESWNAERKGHAHP